MAKKQSIIKSSYLFPNWMIVTYGHGGDQLPDYQGKYTEDLHRKILERADSKTEMHGFPKLKEDGKGKS